MDYPQEQFTADEQRLLEPHFTNLDSPVFCVVNLPEVVKGALFARYSRYGGTLRRLYLDEFAGEDGRRQTQATVGHRARRTALYERVFLEFGDDSVAQLGGAHLACEWSSNVLTKILQRGRLAAYLEQSTRYIAYDRRMPSGRYRYYWDERLGPAVRRGDGADLRPLLGGTRAACGAGRPSSTRAATSRRSVWERSIKAKALDAMRGLLPAASLSHVGVYASGQAYEQLLMRLLASPLPEAREFGERALRGAAQGDPRVREAGRHARPRRCLDRLPARGCGSRPRRRRRASASTTHTRGEEPPPCSSRTPTDRRPT